MASAPGGSASQKKSRWDMSKAEARPYGSGSAGCGNPTEQERSSGKGPPDNGSTFESKLGSVTKTCTSQKSADLLKGDKPSKSEAEAGAKRFSSVLTKEPEAKALSIKLATKPKEVSEAIAPKKAKIAAVFNEESESDEEEMPIECRMKMRNMGRETPTSAGPKSFNKTKKGFMNSHKQFELSMKPRTHLEKQTKLDDV